MNTHCGELVNPDVCEKCEKAESCEPWMLWTEEDDRLSKQQSKNDMIYEQVREGM